MSRSPKAVLIIYSHGRSPPLHPAPDLKYDLRNIPNPPKALRQVSDGRSKRLREHLLSEPKFVQRLEAVEHDILNLMKDRLAEYVRNKEPENVDDQSIEGLSAQEEGQAAGNSTPTFEAEEEHGSEAESSSAEDDVILRVGCNCALGHHRSVAFVEELSRRPWPREWHVEIVHRDLGKKRDGGARRAQKASFRDKVQDAFED